MIVLSAFQCGWDQKKCCWFSKQAGSHPHLLLLPLSHSIPTVCYDQVQKNHVNWVNWLRRKFAYPQKHPVLYHDFSLQKQPEIWGLQPCFDQPRCNRSWWCLELSMPWTRKQQRKTTRDRRYFLMPCCRTAACCNVKQPAVSIPCFPENFLCWFIPTFTYNRLIYIYILNFINISTITAYLYY